MKLHVFFLCSFFVIFSSKLIAQDDWLQKASLKIEEIQNQFYKIDGTKNFRVTNNNNNLSFIISPLAYKVQNLQAEWNTSFSLVRYGKGIGQSLNPHHFYANNNSTNLVYKSPAINIEYINNKDGLRQNFIINKKPEGNKKLSLSLKLESALTPSIAQSNQLVFSTEENKVQLIYDQLKVWDANQNLLAANMSLDNASNILTITVDDENASYPVTIDPLNRNPEWTTSADGILPGLLNNLQLQVQTTYGLTVAGLGDINGDGFDDVAVSAPTMADVITGSGSLTGVGAVFIYLGSLTGLSTTPDKILQPTTAVTGALFGYSVDAGDITGDGKNDIVIGAPLDRYQTSASSLLGTTNVNVTAGKVYVYRSEDLFTAPNPTPFLEIKLKGSNFFSTGVLNLLGSNISNNPLFGYSVSVTQDLNGDNKADILVGSPAYLGVNLLSVRSGAAFVYYSDNLNTSSPVRLQTPSPTLLGLVSLPIANTDGLLFGYSIDGAGDYNGDGYADVIVGAPAGVDLSSLGGIFSGQFLGGSAFIYYGTGTGVNTSSSTRLQASASGLLSNTANLFGFDVKGAKNAIGAKTGNVLVSAPVGSVLSNVLNGLRVKAGEVHVFKKKSTGASGTFQSDQVISSPRSSSILSILSGQTINVSMLFGASIDNMLDVNCDNIGDIIVGEPLSSAVPLLGADVVGGAAYVYLGNDDGTYSPAPIWNLYTNISPLLGVNTTALMGYSVAGAGYVKGRAQGVRSLVGGPSNSLDFGSGLLNLGNTLGTTFSLVFDNNGIGKAYSFDFSSCNISLPVNLISFSGTPLNKMVKLDWSTASEERFSHFELQRGSDGNTFNPIAVVLANGNQFNEYNYLDQKPGTGLNYYRLKMIDRDNSYEYSKIVAVRFGEKISGTFVVAPNPAKGDINLWMNNLDNGNYRIDIVNVTGQLLFTKMIQVSTPSKKETITLKGQPGYGVFFLNVYNSKNEKLKTLKIFNEKQ